MDELSRRALSGVAKFQLAMALLLFVPAWTVRYWQAWLYVALFLLCVLAITCYFLQRDRALIERRLEAGPAAEKRPSQRAIQLFASVCLGAVFVVAGLDRRFGGSAVAPALSVAADVVVVAGLAIVFFVFKENSHASAVVDVSTGQRVVVSGPYRFVRHPMYSGAALAFIVTPIALGSLWSLIPAIALCAAIVARLVDEERHLAGALPGYRQYLERVHYRLVPLVWQVAVRFTDTA